MENIKPLMSFVDTLHLGFYLSEIKLTEDDFKRLDEAKRVARESGVNDPGLFEFQGKWFKVTSNKKLYGYVLYNDDVTVKISRKLSNGAYPEMFVEFRSRFLLGGLKDAYHLLKEWVEKWAVISSEKVSRVDLTTDFQGDIISDLNLDNIVRRSKKWSSHFDFKSSTHGLGRRITGHDFGSGDIMLRIYDKTLEIEDKGKQYVKAEWEKCGWDKISMVSRIEFQLRRGFLKEFKVETVDDLMLKAPDIWRYLTEDWFSICEPSESDKTRSRWSPSSVWRSVIDSFARFGELSGAVREKIKQVSLENLMPQAVGLVTSCMALMLKRKIDVIEFFEMIEKQCNKKGKTIEDVVLKKIERYSLFEESPAQLLNGY